MTGAAGGAGLGQAALALTAPVAALIYSPENLGVLGIVSAAAVPVSIVLAWRLDVGLPAIKSAGLYERTVHHLSSLALTLLKVGVAVGTVAVGMFWLYGYSSTEANIFAFTLLAASSLVEFDTTNFAAVRNRAFRAVAVSSAMLGMVQATALIALGLLKTGDAGPVLAFVGARWGAGCFLRRSSATGLAAVERGGLPRFRQIGAEHRSYIRMVTPSLLLANLMVTLPTLAVGAALGLEAAGIFFLVRRLVLTPSRLISGAIAKVAYGNIAASLDMASVRAVLFRALKVTTPVAALVLGAGIAAFVGNFTRVFGADWSSAQDILLPLAITGSAQILQSPFRNVLVALSEHRILLSVQIGRFLIVGGACLFFVAGSFDLIAGTWILSMATLASYGVGMFGAGFALRNRAES